VEREDMRVLEMRGGSDLVQKALGAHDGGQLGAEHLERDEAVVPDVVSEVDGGHAAVTELSLDLIAFSQRGREAKQLVLCGHADKMRRAARGGQRGEGEARRRR